MGVVIDKEKCIGCKKCVLLCPGNIIRQDDKGKAFLRQPADCWSCASCVKECGAGAISLVLSTEMGGTGGTMNAEKNEGSTKWTIEKGDGDTITLITHTDVANSY